eukprot:jgi/Mesen1/4236/ME000022S03519
MLGFGGPSIGGKLIVHAFVTATVLGALKNAGWITVHPRKIANETVRKVFEAALRFGEGVVIKATHAYRGVKAILPGHPDGNHRRHPH